MLYKKVNFKWNKYDLEFFGKESKELYFLIKLVSGKMPFNPATCTIIEMCLNLLIQNRSFNGEAVNPTELMPLRKDIIKNVLKKLPENFENLDIGISIIAFFSIGIKWFDKEIFEDLVQFFEKYCIYEEISGNYNFVLPQDYDIEFKNKSQDILILENFKVEQRKAPEACDLSDESTEGTFRGYEFFQYFVLLLKAQIQIHPGYPELYIPLLEKIDSALKNNGIMEDDKERVTMFIGIYEKKFSGINQHQFQDFQDLEDLRTEQRNEDKDSKEAEDKVKKFLYSGFINTGNTCYMNSFLQALFMSEDFRKWLINDIAISFPSMIMKPSSKLSIEQLPRLFWQMAFSSRRAIKPSAFRSTIPTHFLNFAQQDWSEFGKTFLDKMEEEIKEMNKE